ncbi:histone-lysine N-methyltransferase eggless [Acyrthosiphon pisum]|uniref:Histone-lysine N-methyltransferase eggless n=1 Tax=Acyrthosiphon pisum TaxID=7029 RepID=A0A8R2AA52_ACYPI|nr:histone-lysine N-methyltransferase eggless [Acyrthosiphon pisum]|eukprot:XP_001952618.2 PREDICTED: histone-lysine N-methyltransferase eggless [Acyrthosiphon pisum]
MASLSKNLEPYHSSDEGGGNSKEEQRRQLTCINRRCRNGDTLIEAMEIACTYYDVDYKPGKEVCMTCFINCLKHYKYLEMKWKEGKCIMESNFPCFDSYLVIDDSSGEEEEEEAEKEKQKPSTSKVGLPPNPVIKKAMDWTVVNFFDRNIHLFERQIKLSDKYMDEGIKQCQAEADEIDEFIFNLENQMESLKNEIYSPYEPIVTSLEPVDIDELEDNMEEEQEEVNIPQKEINKFIAEIKMPKEAKKVKSDNSKKSDISDKDDIITIDRTESDKDDIITIDRTVCVVPANLPVEGPLEYPGVEAGQIVYAMKLTKNDPWYIAKIKNIVNEDYVHVMFYTGEKLVTTKQIAHHTLNSVRFPVGCRVIAKFTDPNSKYTDEFYAGLIAEPPKMLNNFRYLIFFDDGCAQYRHHQDIRLIARRASSHYVWKEVEENSQDFIKSYLEKYPERQMVKLTKQHSVRAEHQGQWHTAKVLEVDASLVKLYFTDFKHTEWIYRGSSRLYNIFEKQMNSERGIRLRQSGLAYLKKPFVEFTSVEEEPSRLLSKVVTRKSTGKNSTTSGDGTQKWNKNKANATKVFDLFLPKNAPNPLRNNKHKCTPLCIAWTKYNYDRTRSINMLTIPLHFGFDRIQTVFNNKSQKCVLYRTPCGVTIRNLKQMLKYLIATQSAMTIDQFDFNSWVKPFAEYKILKSVQFLEDISEGQEFRGIPCVNIINSTLPPKMDYMTTRQPMPGVNINVESKFLCGCDCTDNCQDKSKCACWKMTIEGQKILPNLYKDPNIGYNYRRLPERVLTGIYECNKTCKCSSSCLNRVVQNPLSQKLQLFMTEKKGWGVQCLNDIPQGSFICIYVGYLLTETDANEGGKNYGDEYLAELDYIEVVEKIKEDYESEVPDSDPEYETETNQSESSEEHYPSTSDGRRSGMSLKLRKRNKSKTKKDGKHVQVLSKLNARNMKNNPKPPKSVREYFGNNESVYIMDAKTSGNIGRYLNHSCSPNTFVQNVFVDTHDLRFPWVSFFALHYIPAGTELTWDYSYDVGSVPGKRMKCHCESLYCRGRLL